MLYLINFSNQVAAGPRMIAKNFIIQSQLSCNKYIFIIPNIEFYDDLPEGDNVKYIKVNSSAGSWKSLLLIFYVNLFLIPQLCRKYNIERLLSFGNFCFGYKKIPNVVLLHHPYLVDDILFRNLSIFKKVIESIKRKIFIKTIKSCNKIIVQSNYMEQLYLDKYGDINPNAVVIANPISNHFTEVKNIHRSFQKKCIILFYPSRFYAHKNHEQLLNLAIESKKNKINIKILVTIDPKLPGASEFLERTKNLNNIQNLGEISQYEMIFYYKNSTYLFFPSMSETYGNTLAEAIFCSLPVIAPSLGYSKVIVKNAGWYYDPKKTHEQISVNILDFLMTHSELDYQQLVTNCKEIKKELLLPHKWHNRITEVFELL